MTKENTDCQRCEREIKTILLTEGIELKFCELGCDF
jgi:hypothetical protein